MTETRADPANGEVGDRTLAEMAATTLVVGAASAAAIAAAPTPAAAGALVAGTVLSVSAALATLGHLRATGARVCLPRSGVCVGPSPT